MPKTKINCYDISRKINKDQPDWFTAIDTEDASVIFESKQFDWKYLDHSGLKLFRPADVPAMQKSLKELLKEGGGCLEEIWPISSSSALKISKMLEQMDKKPSLYLEVL